MSQTPGLHHFMSDLYPGQMGTRDLSLAEPEDQNTLVDDQKLANQAQVTKHDPVKSKKIWLSIVAALAVVILLSRRGG